MKRILLAVAMALVATSCSGSNSTGESCDLGLGDYTQDICSQAAQAAGCGSYEFTQKSEVVCTGKEPRTRNCCVYRDCDAHPKLPSPSGPGCF